MPTPQILTAAERQAEVADALGRTYARNLSRVQRDLERRMAVLVLEAQAGSETATALANRALVLRSEIRDLLVQAGFNDLADAATIEGFDTMARAIRNLHQAADIAAFTSRDITKITALKELARLDLLAQGDEVAIAVWRAVLQGTYASRSVTDLLDDLALVLDKELAEVGTLYDTTVSIFGRQLELLKATGESDELFGYFGPVDARTRPFCMERVGKVYTRAEIEAMDNGTSIPVILGGAGYNCRHHWTALSKRSELAELHGTGERVPEIQAQVRTAEVQKAAQRRTPQRRRAA